MALVWLEHFECEPKSKGNKIRNTEIELSIKFFCNTEKEVGKRLATRPKAIFQTPDKKAASTQSTLGWETKLT